MSGPICYQEIFQKSKCSCLCEGGFSSVAYLIARLSSRASYMCLERHVHHFFDRLGTCRRRRWPRLRIDVSRRYWEHSWDQSFIIPIAYQYQHGVHVQALWSLGVQRIANQRSDDIGAIVTFSSLLIVTNLSTCNLLWCLTQFSPSFLETQLALAQGSKLIPWILHWSCYSIKTRLKRYRYSASLNFQNGYIYMLPCRHSRWMQGLSSYPPATLLLCPRSRKIHE